MRIAEGKREWMSDMLMHIDVLNHHLSDTYLRVRLGVGSRDLIVLLKRGRVEEEEAAISVCGRQSCMLPSIDIQE